MINETGKETAQKIRKALKQTFPTIKFSVRSDFDSVHVTWEDGPLEAAVYRLLQRFESYETRRIGPNDRLVAVGYEWEGQWIVGAQWINAKRSFSEERRRLVENRMMEKGIRMLDAKVPDLMLAELELIAEKELEGCEPAAPVIGGRVG
ncbi:hypothetical protein KM868_09645 [Micrococcus luteus]|nr:hypothetical protein [Micrococcus luteus]